MLTWLICHTIVTFLHKCQPNFPGAISPYFTYQEKKNLCIKIMHTNILVVLDRKKNQKNPTKNKNKKNPVNSSKRNYIKDPV